jgi:hypothetical protein
MALTECVNVSSSKSVTRVTDLENNKIGEVIDILSCQFTAEFDGKIKYFFYKDKGCTWQPLSEEAHHGSSNQSRT